LSILNKKLLKQLRAIRSILFKKTIAQLILLTTIILKVISLQKEFVLKTKIFNSNLFARSLIDNCYNNRTFLAWQKEIPCLVEYFLTIKPIFRFEGLFSF